MKLNAFRVFLGVILVLSIYLFATAPSPIAANPASAKTISTQLALSILNSENNIARSLYTKEIVLAGKKQGLKFDEDWKLDNVDAGPLPAQFLRETAAQIEKNSQPIGLFLGSDFPINTANLLQGKQMNFFKQIKLSHEPQYFFMSDLNRHIYMAPDIAISKACVSCHNKHKDSPKTDWKLNDIMGATTWTYPNATMDHNNLIEMIAAYRKGVQQTYQRYLDKVNRYKHKPGIGEKWPKQGYYIPSLDVFMRRFEQQAAASTLISILKSNRPAAKDE